MRQNSISPGGALIAPTKKGRVSATGCLIDCDFCDFHGYCVQLAMSTYPMGQQEKPIKVFLYVCTACIGKGLFKLGQVV